jgi:CopG family transcriptional regulator/antitoxin EndoAI
MRNNNGRIFKISLNRHVYKDSQGYDVQTSATKFNSINAVVNQISEKNLTIYDTLRKGYAEMSRINLDICNEFEVCEKEVSAHL